MRHGGNKRLVALGVRREVSNMSQQPLNNLYVTTLVGSQERGDTTVINSLEGKGGREGRRERKRERGEREG